MDEKELPPESVEPSPKRERTVDDFVTWSEIERKIQQVTQPQARPPAPSRNWRWGWLLIPVVLGFSRFLVNGSRYNEPPVYNSPAPRIDNRQINFLPRDADPPPIQFEPGGGETIESLERKLDELRRQNAADEDR